MNTNAAPPSRLLLLVTGFIVWSFAFVALYALNAIGCAFGWDAGFQRAVLVGVFLAHAAFLVWFSMAVMRLLRRAGNEPERMLAYAGLGLTVAALASTAFIAAPAVFVSMCI